MTMRVVTFYSYKGGVGRTLALLNVAATLLRRGNRVLLVDFDLEAPGLDAVEGLTFRGEYPSARSASEWLAAKKPERGDARRGLVDFIGDYLAEGRVPDIRDYVSEAWFVMRPSGNDPRNELPPSARLFVLGAGDRSSEEAYKARLSAIDFRHLYRERDGFLLFDDLRTQWAKALECDYVLIDSRTGHTDIGAICTRQLPDHVIAVMFPNEQNLVGIEAELRAIRASHTAECDLVLSRVPQLDDFEGELMEFEKNARKRVGIRHLLRVHSYDSLTLLRDYVYCADEYLDRTSLSREMRRLTECVEVRNTADPIAVLQTLQKGRNRVEPIVGKKRTADWLRAVAELHRDNEDVLAALLDHARVHQPNGFDAEGVAKRLDLLTNSGERAAAANGAIATEATCPDEAARLAYIALKGKGPLAFSLQLAAYAILCRVEPRLAEQVELPCPPFHDTPKVMQAGASLYRCFAGLRLLGKCIQRSGIGASIRNKLGPFRFDNPPRKVVPLSVSRAGVRFAALPLFALQGSYEGVLAEHDLDLIQRSSALVPAAELPVCPYGSDTEFSVWLWLYSRGRVMTPPEVSGIEQAMGFDTDGDPVFGIRESLEPWEAAGVGVAASIELRGRAVLANLLFGRTAPLELFLEEAQSHRPDAEYWNPWRLLPCRFDEFLADLEEIRRDREGWIAKSKKGAPLPVLPPPFFTLPGSAPAQLGGP